MTAYWTFGGTALLDTIGGYPEELARTRSAPAVFIGLVVMVVKSVGGVVALALATASGGPIRRAGWSSSPAASVVPC